MVAVYRCKKKNAGISFKNMKTHLDTQKNSIL